MVCAGSVTRKLSEEVLLWGEETQELGLMGPQFFRDEGCFLMFFNGYNGITMVFFMGIMA